MTPTISVLVPVRDEAPFLAQALDSLCAQTHAQWEALLFGIDAGALHAHACADPRIRVAGADANRATAAMHARGEFLYGGLHLPVIFAGVRTPLELMRDDDVIETDGVALWPDVRHVSPRVGAERRETAA